VIAAVLALLAPGVAQAADIDSQVIARAVAFWQPYSPTPVCPAGVTISFYAPGQGPPAWPHANGWAVRGIGCEIHLRSDIPDQTPAVQCALIAHELGHAVFSLPDSDDPRNVMGDAPGRYIAIPDGCVPGWAPRKGLPWGGFQLGRGSYRSRARRAARNRSTRPTACGSWPSRCPRSL
jgi:hypothetical protein